MNIKKMLAVSLIILMALLSTACESEIVQPDPAPSPTMSNVSDSTSKQSPQRVEPEKFLEELQAAYTYNHKAMLNHMNFVIPDNFNLTAGEFDLFMGGGGGVPFLKKDDPGDTTQYGGVELWPNIDGIFIDGKLTEVTSLANHSTFSEFTSLPGSVP